MRWIIMFYLGIYKFNTLDMKRIIYYFVLVCIGWFWQGCHEVPIGYLITDYASYNVDSLIIKAELTDLEPGVEIPNPNWQMWIDLGYTPADIINLFGEYPTIVEGRGEDYLRNLHDIPWVSLPLEGLQGTPPIFGDVKSVVAVEGDGAEALKACMTVRGDGTIEIPAKHGVSIGVYRISLTFTNEGYSKDLDDCFTIIVE